MKILLHALFLFLVCTEANAVTLPGIPEFIDEMTVKHHFDRDELTALFEQVEHKPAVIELISRPKSYRSWVDYRASFVNKKRVRLGLAFWDKYQLALQRAEKEYGVPQEVIVSLIGIETVYGQNKGTFRTLDALTTLAFDYPRRSAYFRGELENYLLLAREQQLGYLDLRASYAGAMGIPQFMPGSYRQYGVDFNADHRIDLLNDPIDAIGSVGNYLKAYGWIKGGLIAVPAQAVEGIEVTNASHSLTEWAELGVTVGIKQEAMSRLLDYTLADGKQYWLGFNNFDVITRYNNSDYYAMSVFELGEALKAAHQDRHQ